MKRGARQPDALIVVWVAFSIAAAGLAPFAPAWAIAAFPPAAGLCSWLILRRRDRLERARLTRLMHAASRIGAPEAAQRTGDDHAADQLIPSLEEAEAIIAARSRAVAEETAGHLSAWAALHAALNAVDTPIVSTDQKGRVTLLNRAAERLLATRSRRVEGTALEDVLPNTALLELHARAERGEARRSRIRLTFEGQPRFHEVSAVPVRLDISKIPPHAAQRAGVVLTLRDVHELAQTLRLRTDFAANASHELRTPIASIRTAVETIRGAASDDPIMRERLMDMIESNVARLEEMVHDLLDLSRLESDEGPVPAQPFDAAEMAEALRAMFADASQKRGVELLLEFDEGLREMRTDPRLVLLVLRNLIDNAVKFAFEGTTVRVSGTTTPGNGPLIGARFTVADRGIGIPLKHQERIFERFFQVDESRARPGGRRGSGLGLAIVRHALRRLEGDITVESVWQEGTTMTVDIPRCVAHNTGQPSSGA